MNPNQPLKRGTRVAIDHADTWAVVCGPSRAGLYCLLNAGGNRLTSAYRSEVARILPGVSHIPDMIADHWGAHWEERT